jgi:DNA polymerase-3 subunit gamma/tau
VDRVIEAGGDLNELVAGAGEMLRALLLTALGGEAQGLSEGQRAAIARHQAALPPEEVVRLLALQAEVEPQLKQSGIPRLLVELLMLRWAVMDRTVELSRVLDALDRGNVGTGKPGNPAPVPPVQRSNVPPVQLSDVPTVPRSHAVQDKGSLSLDHLKRVWPEVIARASSVGPMLPALLAGSEVAALEGNTAVIRLGPTGAGHAEGLERKRDVLARLVGEYVTEPVKVKIGSDAAPAARAVRMTPGEAQSERLKALRAKDPALNAAVDALDLELLE